MLVKNNKLIKYKKNRTKIDKTQLKLPPSSCEVIPTSTSEFIEGQPPTALDTCWDYVD